MADITDKTDQRQPISVKRYRERGWATAPISPTCGTLIGVRHSVTCGAPTTHAYPALHGGWATLCERHADNIHPHCTPIADLLAQGETMEAKS